MSNPTDSYPRVPGPSSARNDSAPALPFEAEFDGVRRPADVGERLCDPQRYWTIFDGTD